MTRGHMGAAVKARERRVARANTLLVAPTSPAAGRSKQTPYARCGFEYTCVYTYTRAYAHTSIYMQMYLYIYTPARVDNDALGVLPRQHDLAGGAAVCGSD